MFISLVCEFGDDGWGVGVLSGVDCLFEGIDPVEVSPVSGLLSRDRGNI